MTDYFWEDLEPKHSKFDVDVINIKWYVQPNDLVGGWCISNVDKPPSQHNHIDEFEIGDLLTEEVANYIVSIHNMRFD